MNSHFPLEEPHSISPDEALDRLIEGSRRSAAGQAEHPRQDPERRRLLLAGQRPFAAILSCSDSRVSPELIFDQGIGDLFIIRNAGNVLDEVVEGSLEYAVEHLHIPLVVVLGHSRCGAVTAALSAADAPRKLGSVMRILQGAVISARNLPGDPVLNTAAANVRLNVERLRSELADLDDEFQARVVGGIYHLENGEVEFFED